MLLEINSNQLSGIERTAFERADNIINSVISTETDLRTTYVHYYNQLDDLLHKGFQDIDNAIEYYTVKSVCQRLEGFLCNQYLLESGYLHVYGEKSVTWHKS